MGIEPSSIDQRIGERIHRLRNDRGLTLDGLAHAAEVSRAMLSRIERGESSPTAQLLNKICAGLGITLSTLFAAAEAPANPMARRADQPVWRDPASQYLRRIVTPPSTGSPVDITEIEFPPGGSVSFGSQRLAGADQHVWVLNGTLEMELGGDLFRLETGDCLWMGFDRPILFRNPTQWPTRYAVIISQGGRAL
jgi:transcriptional regulator with XRE-family HTH domain